MSMQHSVFMPPIHLVVSHLLRGTIVDRLVMAMVMDVCVCVCVWLYFNE